MPTNERRRDDRRFAKAAALFFFLTLVALPPPHVVCSDVRVVPASLIEQLDRERNGRVPAIHIHQPGGGLHDQTYFLRGGGEIFPVWLLDDPSSALQVDVEVRLFSHVKCESFAVELTYGGEGGGDRTGEGVQIISKSSCDSVGGGIFTRESGTGGVRIRARVVCLCAPVFLDNIVRDFCLQMRRPSRPRCSNSSCRRQSCCLVSVAPASVRSA